MQTEAEKRYDELLARGQDFVRNFGPDAFTNLVQGLNSMERAALVAIISHHIDFKMFCAQRKLERDSEVINIQTIEKFNIKGRGTVFSASMAANPVVDFQTLIHRLVMIDGVKYRVVSLEKSAKNGFVDDHVGIVVTPAP